MDNYRRKPARPHGKAVQGTLAQSFESSHKEDQLDSRGGMDSFLNAQTD